jgi:hypothetical protein
MTSKRASPNWSEPAKKRSGADSHNDEEGGVSNQLRRSHLARRLKKLEVELTDECGLVPHSAAWRAYWLDWLQRLVNGENPPSKIPDEAFRTLQDEIVIPPHRYEDE